MTKHESTIPIATLKKLVTFDADNGRVYWVARDIEMFAKTIHQSRMRNTWNARYAGKEAFSHLTGAGYLHGSLLGKKILAHRVVFALAKGYWPKSTIDHINGNKTDNRPSNLRDVEHAVNMKNQKKRGTTTTGINGVHFCISRNAYEAHITIKGKKINLGRFNTVLEAQKARLAANSKFDFDENHGVRQ